MFKHWEGEADLIYDAAKAADDDEILTRFELQDHIKHDTELKALEGAEHEELLTMQALSHVFHDFAADGNNHHSQDEIAKEEWRKYYLEKKKTIHAARQRAKAERSTSTRCGS